MKNNPGISETLGAILMIAVFVAGFGILGVVYFSQPPPEKIPSVTFDLKLGDGSAIYLRHAGGDSLRTYNQDGKDAKNNAEYYILIDKSEDWPIKDADKGLVKNEKKFAYIDYPKYSDVEYLKPGEGFMAQPSSLPKEIDVIYKSPSGFEQVIWSGLIPRKIEFEPCGPFCLNEPVQFYDNSTANVIYSYWDFDVNVNPGIDSIDLHPTWTYTEPGLYTVTHSITTDEGLNFSLTKDNCINVKPVHAYFSEDGKPDNCASDDYICNYCRKNYPGKPCGKEPLTVNFSDDSSCSPTSWSWNLGAESIVITQNASYKYIYNYTSHSGKTGDNTLYTVSLTASNSEGSDTKTKPDLVVVLPSCFDPVADFSYDGVVDLDGNMAVDFTDLSEGYPEEIVEWNWDFGDGSDQFFGREPPTHEYDAGVYTVTLTVKNDCGKTSQKSRKIEFPCPTIVAAIEAEPTSGPSPLTVNFTDHSYDRENITGWRWSFGDGTFHYASNVSDRNPPPHTYSKVGTFYANLMAQNKCGQAFVNTSVFVVSKDASISGKIWNDRNEDRIQNSDESNLSGWTVKLEERKDGDWKVVNTTTTNTDGEYSFILEGVSNSVFRVRQEHKGPTIWKTTYSYGTYNQNVSESLLIYDKRHYTDINFGNVDLHRSKISIPGKFYCEGRGWMDGEFYYSSLSRGAQYLDYNTSYDPSPRIVMMEPSSDKGTMTPDPAGGYPDGYTNWGNSSFILSFREYNNYLKKVGVGAYYLDWWEYPIGNKYYRGKDFPVPDNTIITADQLKLRYKFDESIHFDIDKPKEGELIPYTSKYIVEAHFEGKGEQTTKCELMTPISGKLFYNSTVGEYLITDIDTRPYEGKKRLFTARMELKTNPKKYSFAYSNASISFEKTTASITGITSEATWPTNVKGNATVTASVNGKWQDNSSIQLYVGNKPVVNMTVKTPGLPCVVQGTFNVEPFAGKTLPVFIRIPYNSTHSDEIGSVRQILGDYQDSPSVNITVLSKEPIKANFTANPWSGRAPHEVTFTDLSTGGANVWNWNFNDGSVSTVQNPIHIFNDVGNYSVKLTVKNASFATDTIEKNISVVGYWNSTNLLTNRFTTLNSGGAMSFISRGSGSSITVNNTTHAITDGSYVEIILNKPLNDAKIFIAGGITECNLSNVTFKVDDTYIDEGTISDIRIKDFENFHSSMTLVSDRSYSAWISFIWGGKAIPVSWKKVLQINEIMPTRERFMTLELSPSQTFFEGMAGTYNFT